MSIWRAPLWKQLAAVWLGALVLEVILLGLQYRRPFKIFWLIPYPSWRLVWPSVVGLFREYPLLGAALVGVPLLTIGITLVLSLRRVGVRRLARHSVG